MLFSGDTPTLSTVVFFRDRYVMVDITEEDLFRKVLGDKEFDRLVEEAYRIEVLKNCAPPGQLIPIEAPKMFLGLF